MITCIQMKQLLQDFFETMLSVIKYDDNNNNNNNYNNDNDKKKYLEIKMFTFFFHFHVFNPFPHNDTF